MTTTAPPRTAPMQALEAGLVVLLIAGSAGLVWVVIDWLQDRDD